MPQFVHCPFTHCCVIEQFWKLARQVPLTQQPLFWQAPPCTQHTCPVPPQAAHTPPLWQGVLPGSQSLPGAAAHRAPAAATGAGPPAARLPAAAAARALPDVEAEVAGGAGAAHRDAGAVGPGAAAVGAGVARAAGLARVAARLAQVALVAV